MKMKTIDFSNDHFTWFDFPQSAFGRRDKKGFFVSLSRYTSSTQHVNRITFSIELSERVVAKELTHFRVRRDDLTGDTFFVFVKGNANYMTFGYEKNGAIRLYNKQLVKFLCDQLEIKGDFHATAIQLSEDLSNTPEVATFKIITKPQTL